MILKNLVNSLISEIYKSVFYLDFSNNKLKYGDKTISSNLAAIIEFLGLCNSVYRNGFKCEKDVFDYIKGSHYFNIDYFTNIKLINYIKTNPKRNQYEYTRSKLLYIKQKDYENILEKYLIKNINGVFQISFVDYKKYNLQNKYKDILFKEDTTIYLDSLQTFFEKF